MQKERKDKHFIKKPIYEGGAAAMKAFVKKNLNYPKEAFQNKIEGTVYLKYAIDYQGNVTETNVISGLGYGCDEEAERIVKLFQFKVPKSRGVKVLFHKSIQIHFRLPKEKPKPKPAQPQQIQYTLTPKTEKNQTDNQKVRSYTYTIDI